MAGGAWLLPWPATGRRPYRPASACALATAPHDQPVSRCHGAIGGATCVVQGLALAVNMRAVRGGIAGGMRVAVLGAGGCSLPLFLHQALPPPLLRSVDAVELHPEVHPPKAAPAVHVRFRSR